jgi:hypothetical protein
VLKRVALVVAILVALLVIVAGYLMYRARQGPR